MSADVRFGWRLRARGGTHVTSSQAEDREIGAVRRLGMVVTFF